MLTAFTASKIFTGKEELINHAIITVDGEIKDILPETSLPSSIDKINFEGKQIIPGFTDLQLYGGGGVLFSSNPSAEYLKKMAEGLRQVGTTSFMLTLATNSAEIFNKAIEVVKANPQPGLLGLHFEGPYLNKLKKGAHIEEYIKTPTLSEVKELLNRAEGCLKMITLAPEICSLEIIDLLLENDILISAGHSNASYEEGMAAFNRGVQTATHLFNAMPVMHHREPGLAGAVWNHPVAKASIIPDGIHVSYASIEISKKIMGDRLFIITDAVEESTTGPYYHTPKENYFALPDGTLSGSKITMLEGVRNCISYCNISKYEAIRMGTTIPASLVKGNTSGSLQRTKKANFLVVNANLDLQGVYFQGVKVPSKA